MKQIIIIITAAAITVGAGAAFFFLSRSSDRRTRKPCMTFEELYEENSCGIGGLFD